MTIFDKFTSLIHFAIYYTMKNVDFGGTLHQGKYKYCICPDNTGCSKQE